MNIKLTTISIVAFLAITCYSPLTAGSYYSGNSGSTSEYKEEAEYKNSSPLSNFLVLDKDNAPSPRNGGKAIQIQNKSKNIIYIQLMKYPSSNISIRVNPGQSITKSFPMGTIKWGSEGWLKANIKNKRNQQMASTRIEFQGRKNYRSSTKAAGKIYTLSVKWDHGTKGYIATVEEKRARR